MDTISGRRRAIIRVPVAACGLRCPGRARLRRRRHRHETTSAPRRIWRPASRRGDRRRQDRLGSRLASGELSWCQPDGGFAGRVEVTDRETGAKIDLGIGWAPALSPDDSAVAFIQVTGDRRGATEHGARVAVATVQGWQVRTFADIIDPDFRRFGDVARLPQIQWTADGTAIYWLDTAGAHVVDVAGSVIARPHRDVARVVRSPLAAGAALGGRNR
jgi:hypothetical protein